MRHVYISPHLDDAVLSAGGLIWEQSSAGERVEIWTVLCGVPTGDELSPFAQALHRIWGSATAEETIRTRRAEDDQAAHILGAKSVHFDFLDCIYRRGKQGDWLYSDVFIEPQEEDAEYPAEISRTLAAQVKQDDVLISPLGVGLHVDHLIVRQAIEGLGRRLYYYADVPYLFQKPVQLARQAAGMKEQAHAVSKTGLVAWLEAIEVYRSQLGGLFENLDQMRSAIGEYWEESGGIRLWKFE